MKAILAAAVWLCAALWVCNAAAGSKVLSYGPAPTWVKPAPALADELPRDGGSVQILLSDAQASMTAAGVSTYSRTRLKVLTPEGLAVGNLAVEWDPQTETVSIHGLKIVRDGREIDALASNTFTIIQREKELESAMLDGALTATLQLAGLQVGDILDFSTTTSGTTRLPGGRSEAHFGVPMTAAPGEVRLRAIWPKDRSIAWRATPDLVGIRQNERGGLLEVEYQTRNLPSAAVVDGAPDRYNYKRRIDFSQFTGWEDVADVMVPLYRSAANLSGASPLRAEAAKIAAATTDPKDRAARALRLVQDRVRYVYIGLDQGAYRPVAADETWARRFGDCKAKTVLLLALLSELGIKAEPALVSSAGFDGLDERLPGVGYFDHVVVRAELGDDVYWLDGTRLGDRDLDALRTAEFRWALPLRARASLERVASAPLELPQTSTWLDVDVSKGIAEPARLTAERVIRGDEAILFNIALTDLPQADGQRELKTYWTDIFDWVEPETVTWRYDEPNGTLRLTMEGEGRPEWVTGDGTPSTRWLSVAGARFGRPEALTRPRDQDQTIPFAIAYPFYTRWVTTARLPVDPVKSYGYRGDDVDETFGGFSFQRKSSITDRVLLTRTTLRALKPEVTAAEAMALRERRMTLDTKPFWVWVADAAETGIAADAVDKRIAAATQPDVLLDLARLAASESMTRQAEVALDKVLALTPGHVDAAVARSDLLAYSAPDKTATLQRALAPLNRAIKVKPDRQLYLAKQQRYAEAGRADDALASLREGAVALPQDRALLVELSSALVNQRLFDEASIVARRAAALGPPDALIHRLDAAILLGLNQRPQALEHLNDAVRLDPTDPINWQNRGGALIRSGNPEVALRDLEEALAADPLRLWLYGERADALFDLERPAEARAALDDVVRRFPTSASALNARCWTLGLRRLDLDRAAADCEAALKIEPTSSGYIDSYALIAFQTGEYQEAIDRYNRALALSPRLASSLYGRGLAKLRLGDQTGGQSDLKAAQAISQEVARVYDKHALTP